MNTPVVGFERLQRLLLDFWEQHDLLLHCFVGDSPFTREQITSARSRDELVQMAKTLVTHEDAYGRIPDDIHDTLQGVVGTAVALASAVAELELLFPCPGCGGHVSGGDCEECGWERPKPYRGPSLFDDASVTVPASA
jgi:hypothetical protein